MQFDNEIVYRKIGRINQIFKNQLPKTTRKSLIVSPEILNFASNGFLADLREEANFGWPLFFIFTIQFHHTQ